MSATPDPEAASTQEVPDLGQPSTSPTGVATAARASGAQEAPATPSAPAEVTKSASVAPSAPDRTGAAEPLLTDEHLAWIGKRIEFQSDPISSSESRRYTAAADDPNPDYAAEPGSPAPPMLYYAVTRPFVPSAELAEDGTVFEHRPMIGRGQALGGSVEVTWLRPVRIGDQLRGVRYLNSLEEKHGRRRHFALAEWITEYWSEEGELVVRERYEQVLF